MIMIESKFDILSKHPLLFYNAMFMIVYLNFELKMKCTILLPRQTLKVAEYRFENFFV